MKLFNLFILFFVFLMIACATVPVIPAIPGQNEDGAIYGIVQQQYLVDGMVFWQDTDGDLTADICTLYRYTNDWMVFVGVIDCP